MRVKSPEPPMPFMIRLPMMWVELTLPYRSTSTMPFMPMQPSRRTSSGWLEISCGRMMMRSRKKSISRVKDACASGLRAKPVHEATRSTPLRSRSSMPSWMTSVNAVRSRNPLLARPASTALGMLPTPDCSGSRSAGMRFLAIWCCRNSIRCPAMRSLVASTGLNGLLRSGALVRTTATTRSGSTFSAVSPMRSSTCSSGIGLRCGGRAVP